jgi:hypothetical protein
LEAESSCVIMAERAGSAQSSAVPVRRCGINIGAIRIRAPSPADSGPLAYHGIPDW